MAWSLLPVQPTQYRHHIATQNAPISTTASAGTHNLIVSVCCYFFQYHCQDNTSVLFFLCHLSVVFCLFCTCVQMYIVVFGLHPCAQQGGMVGNVCVFERALLGKKIATWLESRQDNMRVWDKCSL